MSSASLIIRKIGSVGALARRKSLTGITSIFKDKSKDKEGDGTDEPGTSGGKKDKKKKGMFGGGGGGGGSSSAASVGISHVTAEVDRVGSSGPDELVGLTPAAKLARQHTLRSNAEAAARAAKVEAERRAQEEAASAAAAAEAARARAEAEASARDRDAEARRNNNTSSSSSSSSLASSGSGPPAWERDTASRRGAGKSGHVRGYSEDGSEEGFTYVSYPGTTGPAGAPEGYFEDEEEEGDDGMMDDEEYDEEEDMTVRRERHESLELEPWAVGVRRSLERVRRPARGILKRELG